MLHTQTQLQNERVENSTQRGRKEVRTLEQIKKTHMINNQNQLLSCSSSCKDRSPRMMYVRMRPVRSTWSWEGAFDPIFSCISFIMAYTPQLKSFCSCGVCSKMYMNQFSCQEIRLIDKSHAAIRRTTECTCSLHLNEENVLCLWFDWMWNKA